jgi:hypothetical protein
LKKLLATILVGLVTWTALAALPPPLRRFGGDLSTWNTPLLADAEDFPIFSDPLGPLMSVPLAGYDTFGEYGMAILPTQVNVSNVIQHYATNGMLAAGYDTIIINDGWQGPRDVNGNLTSHGTNFTGGMEPLARYAHAQGLKIWIYSAYNNGSAGTCMGFPASDDEHLQLDFNNFAKWGYDGIFMDTCGSFDYSTNYQVIFGRKVLNAILRSGKPMALLMGARGGPYSVPLEQIGGANIISGFNRNRPPVPPAAGPYYPYLDEFPVPPDASTIMSNNVRWVTGTNEPYYKPFFKPGHVIFSHRIQNALSNEMVSQVSIAAMFNFPMLTAFRTNANYLQIMTNSYEVIQHIHSEWGWPSLVWSNSLREVWKKKLPNGNVGLMLVNTHLTSAQNIPVSFQSLGLETNESTMYEVRDLWAHNTSLYATGFTANLGTNSVRLFKIVPADVQWFNPNELTYYEGANSQRFNAASGEAFYGTAAYQGFQNFNGNQYFSFQVMAPHYATNAYVEFSLVGLKSPMVWTNAYYSHYVPDKQPEGIYTFFMTNATVVMPATPTTPANNGSVTNVSFSLPLLGRSNIVQQVNITMPPSTNAAQRCVIGPIKAVFGPSSAWNR